MTIRHLLLAAAAFAIAVPVRGQQAQDAAKVEPGMTESDVRDALGTPDATHTNGALKTLQYPNGTVELESGVVTRVDGAPLASSQNAPSTTALPAFRLEGDAVSKQKDDFWSQVQQLFAKEDYAGLEDLGQRTSRDVSTFEDGTYRFSNFLRPRRSATHRTEEDWQAERRRLEAWETKYPQSTVARLYFLVHLNDYAWSAKTPGKAVSDSAWTQFYRRLIEADPIVHALDTLPPNPFTFSVLAQLAASQDWPKAKVRELFLAAKAKHPDIWSYDTNYAYYLKPQFEGEPEDIERMCAEELRRPGGLGAEGYARVAIYLGVTGEPQPYTVAGLNWDIVHQALLSLVRKHPNSRYLWSALAAQAALAGDRATAQQAFDELQGVGDPEIFRTDKIAHRLLLVAYGP